MSDHIEPQDYELFTELSEQEQETVTGGYDIFIQKKDIANFATNEVDASDGIRNISSRQQTGYMLSQITIGFNLDTLFGGEIACVGQV
jgi:hypothetical protein